MPGTVIGKSMNYGYPGTISRHGDEVSRTRPVKASTDNIYFGAPVAQNSDGSIQLFDENFVAADFCGIAMRKVKSAVVYPNQNFGYYAAKEPCDVLERGGVMGVCAWGTPAVGVPVFIRIGTTVGVSPDGAAVGDLGAEAEGTPTAGANTYTISTNVANNDDVEFEGVTLKAGTDFEVGANAAASAADLAAAFNASTLSAIFTFDAVAAVIHVTERVAGGGNTPGTMKVKTGGTGVITAGTKTDSAPGNTVKLEDVVWSSGKDSRNVAEITIKVRKGV